MTHKKCIFKFKHSERTRDYCGLDINRSSSKYCPLHDPNYEAIDEKINILKFQLCDSEHWLEGIILIGADLSNLYAHRGKLPFADLSETKLCNAILTESLLESAYLQSSNLDGASFHYSNLLNTNFRNSNLSNVHMEGSNISGANLEGCTFHETYLFSVTFSIRTVLNDVVWGQLGEDKENNYSRSSSVYKNISRYYNTLGEFRLSDNFYYLGMRSEQHSECGSGSNIIKQIRWNTNWLLWGYGVRPSWPIAWLLFVYLVFGLAIFPYIGIMDKGVVSHSLSSGLALSSVTIATLGYGNLTPDGRIGEILAGLEAILGALLSSSFIVALATRFVRRA